MVQDQGLGLANEDLADYPVGPLSTWDGFAGFGDTGPIQGSRPVQGRARFARPPEPAKSHGPDQVGRQNEVPVRWPLRQGRVRGRGFKKATASIVGQRSCGLGLGQNPMVPGHLQGPVSELAGQILLGPGER
jgi:hypothetical protein